MEGPHVLGLTLRNWGSGCQGAADHPMLHDSFCPVWKPSCADLRVSSKLCVSHVCAITHQLSVFRGLSQCVFCALCIDKVYSFWWELKLTLIKKVYNQNNIHTTVQKFGVCKIVFEISHLFSTRHCEMALWIKILFIYTYLNRNVM